MLEVGQELSALYRIAHAAGFAAGDRSMRLAGRTSWNDQDLAECEREFARLFGYEEYQEAA